MAKRSVDFFFDVISPYSYFGFEGITRHRHLWSTPVRLRPFYFAGVIKQSKNESPPLAIPIKEKYMYKDLVLNAQYWGVSFRIPKDYKKMMFTSSSIEAQRLLIAAQLRDEKLMENIARGLWQRLYGYNKEIFSRHDMESVLRDRHVKDANELIESSQSDEVKKILRENTDEALQTGCFGAPWTTVKDASGKTTHAIFGGDRLPQIADLLGEKFHGNLLDQAKSQWSL
ncbi:unnamed protein product [Caenorhabditis auriculariae]|uniref:Glutathione S-transferase kappa n=1 Tax=Caenorhabditis auriculariae TaxID=2777116 RepID=A0A8S1HU88_9PELO|nr:unnamed protein product [Caenorhabditis auriculariae]